MTTTVLALIHGDVPSLGDLLLLLVVLAVMILAVVLAVIDARTMLLPNKLLLPAYPATAAALLICAGVSGEWNRALWALIGGAGLWGAFWVYGLLGPAGHLGFGDVKLMGWLGMVLGYVGAGTPAAFLLPILIAFVTAAVVGLLMLLARRITLKDSIPFGPFLVLGSLITLVLI
ncbi:prepilin peptidase [Arthrobacter woluwensis]|uniref:prepilin peptidase n=1 Tax=Arthrobacter woluwensis TaxID=156980 RepID=UPI00381AF6EC